MEKTLQAVYKDGVLQPLEGAAAGRKAAGHGDDYRTDECRSRHRRILHARGMGRSASRRHLARRSEKRTLHHLRFSFRKRHRASRRTRVANYFLDASALGSCFTRRPAPITSIESSNRPLPERCSRLSIIEFESVLAIKTRTGEMRRRFRSPGAASAPILRASV